MPNDIKKGIVYISTEYNTVIHLCACGCGEEVNTPLSPTDWKLIYNGKDISLSPSIGNWNFDCRSHYWIKENRVVWAESWSDKQVNFKREYDKKERDSYYESKILNKEKDLVINEEPNKSRSFWRKLLKFFSLIG